MRNALLVILPVLGMLLAALVLGCEPPPDKAYRLYAYDPGSGMRVASYSYISGRACERARERYSTAEPQYDWMCVRIDN